MKLKINGEEETLETPLTVMELLKTKDVSMPEMVSVELNGEILEKEEFASKIVQENDAIEFLYFMGGGV